MNDLGEILPYSLGLDVFLSVRNFEGLLKGYICGDSGKIVMIV
jgi:hypothetical protein